MSKARDFLRALVADRRGIPGRGQAEQALRDSEALYHSLVESLPMHVFRKDVSGRFTFANQLFCDTLRVPLDQIVGKTDLDFYPRELADKYRRDDREVVQKGAVLETVEEHRRPDGRTIYVEVLKTPVLDSQGRIIGTQGIFWDVTARKEAEEALRASEERTRLILETAYDAFVAMDAAGVISEWNRLAEVTFGWSREEVIGRPLAETIMPPRFREAHKAGLARFLATGEGPVLNQRIELAALHRDGHEFPVELTIWPIRAGRDYYFNAFLQDITVRKRSAAQLQQAKEAAEAANRAKSRFLANVSHEIRTPMNAILGMTELVLDTTLADEQREYLEMVRESAESLMSVINDVLDFSKIEAGKLDLDRIEFRLRASVDDTIKSFALRARQRQLALACRIQADVPDALVGDPGRLRQVLVNLVDNAIKFTDKGEVVVRIEAEGQSEGHVGLHFAVADTGIGIALAKQQIIFDAFEQADGSTTRQYGGTGLGLAIAAKLVELMGGRIWVESQPGRGSTFHFTARFALSPEATGLAVTQPTGSPGPPARAGQRSGEAARRPDGRRRPLSILVAEDSPMNQKLAVRLLQQRGHSALVASNGREAVALAEKEPVDLVLMDLQMPEMDGFEATAALRALEQARGTHIPIVAMTAHAMTGDRQRCLEAGMDGYISKPIRAAELFEVIEGMAAGSAGREATLAAQSASAAVVDWTAAVARLQGDEKLLSELAEVFLHECPGLLARLHEALADRDAPKLQLAAHTLTGSVMSFAAAAVFEASRRLEVMGQQNNLAGAEEACRALETEVERLGPALAALAKQAKVVASAGGRQP